MKNTLYIVGSFALVVAVGFFIHTMLTTGPLTPVKELRLEQGASVSSKRSQIYERVEQVDRKSLSEQEMKLIREEFSSGKGKLYKLSPEQEVQIMKALNNTK